MIYQLCMQRWIELREDGNMTNLGNIILPFEYNGINTLISFDYTKIGMLELLVSTKYCDADSEDFIEITDAAMDKYIKPYCDYIYAGFEDTHQMAYSLVLNIPNNISELEAFERVKKILSEIFVNMLNDVPDDLRVLENFQYKNDIWNNWQ